MTIEVRQYFIENLTHSAWLRKVWPRLRRDRRGSPGPARVLFIDADEGALALARFMVRRTSIVIERFDFGDVLEGGIGFEGLAEQLIEL